MMAKRSFMVSRMTRVPTTLGEVGTFNCPHSDIETEAQKSPFSSYHAAGKWQHLTLNLGCLAPELMLSSTSLTPQWSPGFLMHSDADCPGSIVFSLCVGGLGGWGGWAFRQIQQHK